MKKLTDNIVLIDFDWSNGISIDTLESRLQELQRIHSVLIYILNAVITINKSWKCVFKCVKRVIGDFIQLFCHAIFKV